jgi:hypothetical protein
MMRSIQIDSTVREDTRNSNFEIGNLKTGMLEGWNDVGRMGADLSD